MRIALLLLAMLSLNAFSSTHVIQMRDGIFGTHNYPDVIIKERCIYGVIYLISDNGHIAVALNSSNKPITCKIIEEEK